MYRWDDIVDAENKAALRAAQAWFGTVTTFAFGDPVQVKYDDGPEFESVMVYEGADICHNDA
jgi:hypothetical protein